MSGMEENVILIKENLNLFLDDKKENELYN